MLSLVAWILGGMVAFFVALYNFGQAVEWMGASARVGA